ncbi:MAG: hypothetical protein H8E31_10130 [Planctomycetes bacterium]|nr:hypothetical protein [Planctomycetota bacterium]
MEPHRPWEHDKSFDEVLADTMKQAPYLLVSLAIHGLGALLLAGLAFLRPEEADAPVISVRAQEVPPIVEEIKPEELVDVVPELLDPVLQDVNIEEDVLEQPEDQGDPDFTQESPIDIDAFQNPIGLGPGGGGDLGVRGKRGGPKGRGNASEKSVMAALRWLRDHQAPEGYWDSDEFMYYDKRPERPESDGPGSPVNDVGDTGLALLAFLGHGDTLSSGEFSDQVIRGVNWLRASQLDNGLFGEEVGNPTLYNHSIATMAMGEAYLFGRSPILRPSLLKAVRTIIRARNEYGVWRYSLTPNGDNDTSITGWMVFALETARDAGIAIDDAAFRESETWFDTMTDSLGRCGYNLDAGPGSRPSRPRGDYAERFPADRSEALTAVSLLCRIFMTDTSEVKRWKDHPKYEVLKKHADLLAENPPVWDAEGGSCDFYYWYYGTFAMNQWGGEHWKQWRKSIEQALLPHQRMEDPEDNFYGSWDPVGPWGEDGGRVYSTAVGALILEVYYRYGHVLGSRG